MRVAGLFGRQPGVQHELHLRHERLYAMNRAGVRAMVTRRNAGRSSTWRLRRLVIVGALVGLVDRSAAVEPPECALINPSDHSFARLLEGTELDGCCSNHAPDHGLALQDSNGAWQTATLTC